MKIKKTYLDIKMGKQIKLWDKKFKDFIGKKEKFSVVRILNTPYSIVKDIGKSIEFEEKWQAIKYFNSIKNDYVENCEVMTILFKGTEIDKEYSKIKNCPKIIDLKLKL